MVIPGLHAATPLRVSAPHAVREQAPTGQGVRPLECDVPESVRQPDGGHREEPEQQATHSADAHQARAKEPDQEQGGEQRGGT